MEQMNGTGSRFNLSNIIAASIVALGLVAAALIMTHRPQAITTDVPSAKSVVTPPMTQESVGQQFHTQILAAPNLHTVHVGGVTATLTDVEVSRVVYSPKDDTYHISFNYDWQPDISQNVAGGDDPTLTNDGYGHYFGYVTFNNDTSVLVTMK